MKPNPKAQGFFDSPFARCESRFKKADIGLLAERSIQAHFGRTLKKLFPLLPERSEPDEMHVLLQKFKQSSKKDFERPSIGLTMLQGRERHVWAPIIISQS
jgi:hypothetical protein